jgi:hypothetical protein
MSSLIGSTSSFLDDVLQDRRLHCVIGHQLIQRETENSFLEIQRETENSFLEAVSCIVLRFDEPIFAISRLENLPVLQQYRPSIAFLLYALFA